MTLSLLPPAPIFTQSEILHAIPIPPLATFLTSLHLPDHLIKLDDILNRYRTPSSYHRIDVRVVGSSELPPFSPSSGLDAREERKDEKKRREEEEKGEPVILPEGVTKEDYLATRARAEINGGQESLGFSLGDANEAQRGTEGIPIPEKTTSTAGQEDTPSASASRHPEPETAKSLPDSHLNDQTIPPDTVDINESQGTHLNNPSIPIHHPPHSPQTSPIPSHTVPPGAPTRRIRELRLDLRTLDAAALFALETWRRQVLNLEELDMEHPDSIWYKAPSPSPPPPVAPTRTGRPRGRPKSVRSDSVTDDNREVNGKLDKGDEVTEGVRAGAPTTANVDGDERDLAETTILRALDELAKASQPVTETPMTKENDIDGPGPSLKKHDGDDSIDDDYAPSPDVILDDNFDEDDEKDADFAPPRVSGSRSSAKRKRQSEREIQEEAELESQREEDIVRDKEREKEKKKRGRPRKSVTFAPMEDDLESITGEYNKPSLVENRMDMEERVDSFTPVKWDRPPEKSSLKKRNSATDSVEIRIPKRHKIITPPATISPPSISPSRLSLSPIIMKSGIKQNTKAVPVLTTHDEDSENEEWGFLRDL